MRATSVCSGCPVSALEYLLSHALDTEVKTSGGLIAHFYVVYVGALEQVPHRGGLILGGGDEHAFHQLLAGGIAVQDDCIGLEVRRIAGIRGVASAGLLVDKDGPGQRNSFYSGKRIIGKQCSVFLPDPEDAQAVTAWSVAGSQLGVCGVSIARSFARRAHLGSGFTGQRDHVEARHCFSPWEVWPQEPVCLERRNVEIRFLRSNSCAKPEQMNLTTFAATTFLNPQVIENTQ